MREETRDLDLDVDDLPNDEPAGDEHHCAGHQQAGARTARGERLEVRWTRRDEEQGGADRQRGDHAPTEAALSGERANEPAELGPTADRLRDPVEDLGRVAAGVTLEGRDQPDIRQFLAPHSLRDAAKRLVERHTEALVADGALQLA